jgi:hypothetical protein
MARSKPLSGTHTGYWTYGPPTGKHWLSRTVAHCLVVDNKVSEEWLVRDEWAVLENLGLDPYRIAADLAESSPVLRQAMELRGNTGAFAGHIENAALKGVSGVRPKRFERECAMVQGVFEEVWNQRLFNRVPAYFDRQIVCQTTRMRRTQGIDPYQIDLVDLLASLPDFKVEVRDIAVLDGAGSRPPHRRALAPARHLLRRADLWADHAHPGERSRHQPFRTQGRQDPARVPARRRDRHPRPNPRRARCGQGSLTFDRTSRTSPMEDQLAGLSPRPMRPMATRANASPVGPTRSGSAVGSAICAITMHRV